MDYVARSRYLRQSCGNKNQEINGTYEIGLVTPILDEYRAGLALVDIEMKQGESGRNTSSGVFYHDNARRIKVGMDDYMHGCRWDAMFFFCLVTPLRTISVRARLAIYHILDGWLDTLRGSYQPWVTSRHAAWLLISILHLKDYALGSRFAVVCRKPILPTPSRFKLIQWLVQC